MMNCARIHMKMWIAIKNEHKAEVQRRWDNRGKTREAFQDWKKRVWPEYYTLTNSSSLGRVSYA
eukprot:2552588-Pleurochrysis_carterae.AAC.1